MFTASDGIKIDVKENILPGHRPVLVLWPCMTGSTVMYRLPVAEFNNAGISVLQFNPRGHGKSGGQFDMGICIRDLAEYLKVLNLRDAPLWFIGHSAGSMAVLKYGTRYNTPGRYILISPVLDSKASYSYLYEKNNQLEANMLISSFSTDREFMLNLLENSRWMERSVWEKNLYRKKIDALSGNLKMGQLMEKLFIEGYNAFLDLELHGKETLMLLPGNDNWFPIDVTLGLAEKYGIRSETVKESGDHYFTGAWEYAWRRILDEMIK